LVERALAVERRREEHHDDEGLHDLHFIVSR